MRLQCGDVVIIAIMVINVFHLKKDAEQGISASKLPLIHEGFNGNNVINGGFSVATLDSRTVYIL